MDAKKILSFRHWDDCKIHLASWNGDKNPLDVFLSDRVEWQGWNEYRGKKNVFNRTYIFSLIEFYHEPNAWLFGGFFRVVNRHEDWYEIELCSDCEELIGRLKLSFERPGRARVLKDSYLSGMSLLEILREPYNGEPFCGYEKIDHEFSSVELIMRENRPDWKAALENVKGVYLITDKHTGKRYVGSAYGASGIWSRWSCYIGTGHGWNDEMTKLIQAKGIDYARSNFKFTLLEYRPMKTDDHVLIEREGFWKDVLLTRGQFGLNRN
ncbi:GIY-YIG nuclease family protein [Thiorhodovibrio frisius]|uniref:GIY-YIG domain-containing protein n=1 Tax=Thiorhodovibrio frisius TaxID=631362 RepID=H8Z5E1_9GAMM|nr:GIY-YIG nuclease family protein [Thiorhodovibrio frisius]EIC19487.1 hypothetical protein Thi970DRAFT_03064 [Thiorhodovibrio frisius]WPL20550.1 group I intron endonuclease [Thiorhodovibrio frisius]